MNSLANVGDIVDTFVIFDDLSALLQLNKQIAGRKPSLTLSEIATISLLRSEYGIRTWKGMYLLLKTRFTHDFTLPVYKNFVRLMNLYSKVLLLLLNVLLQVNRQRSGIIKIIDSTSLPVCKNMRITRHKTMRQVASRSKTSTGWFYGLKLHLVSDPWGNILHIRFTTANVGDRVILDRLLDKIHHSIILADAGYISRKLERKASHRGNLLLTCTRKSMRTMATFLDICLLNLRPRIESLFSLLKERLGLVTSLPRSVNGYLAHYIHVVFGYVVKKAIL